MTDEPTYVPTDMVARATGSINEEVEKDLELSDPSPETAKAVLRTPESK